MNRETRISIATACGIYSASMLRCEPVTRSVKPGAKGRRRVIHHAPPRPVTSAKAKLAADNLWAASNGPNRNRKR